VMATFEIFMEQTGSAELLIFVVAQVCMMAAAGFVGYMIGRHRYEATEVTEKGNVRDGIEGRAGINWKENPDGEC